MLCESEQNDVCSTPACKLEAENIIAKLNESVDPCEDFYLFACGTFLNQTTIPDEKTSVDPASLLEDKMKEQLNEVLNQTITSDDISPIVSSKKLYRACLNEGMAILELFWKMLKFLFKQFRAHRESSTQDN